MSTSGPPANPTPPTSTIVFYNLLQAYADYDPSPGLASALRKVTPEVLRGTADGRDLVEILDGTKHGVGLLLVLCDRAKSNEFESGILLNQIQNFTVTVRPSALQVLPEFANQLSEIIINLAGNLTAPQLAIVPLTNLIHRSGFSEGVLTPMHAALMRASLAAREYTWAMEVMNYEILDVAPKALHGNYKQAMQMLEVAVSAPGPSISHIQIESFKKLILIQLLSLGTTKSLPKYTNNSIKSALKSLSGGAYSEFVAVFEAATKRNEKGKRVRPIVDKYRETFEKDQNMGLVQQCLASIPKRTLLSLTKIYATLSLSHLSELLDLSPPETLILLQSLISTKELYATISSGPVDIQVIRFEEPKEEFNSEETVARLQRCLGKVDTWQRYTNSCSRDLEGGKEFVNKVVKDSREAGSYGMPSYGAGLAGLVMPEDLAGEVEGMGWQDDFGN